MSSVVIGVPSDHFNPRRRVKVNTRLSASTSKLSATLPMIGATVCAGLIRKCSMAASRRFQSSSGLAVTERSVPPYLPISTVRSSARTMVPVVTTSGFSGSRSSTGGSSPAATIAARAGASPNAPLSMAAVVVAAAAPSSPSPPAQATSAGAAPSSAAHTIRMNDRDIGQGSSLGVVIE